MRATARITFSSPGGEYSRKMALVLRMPSSLRIEAIPFFGPTEFFLSANEENLKVFFPGEGKFYVGAATRKNLALFFRVPLAPADVVPLLAGVPPRVTAERLSGHAEGELYRIDIESGEGRRSLWVDPDDYTVARIEDSEENSPLWSAAFEDRVAVRGTSYPRRIRIETHGPEGVRMDIRYLDLDVASTGDAATFDLPIPPGITPIPMERCHP